MKKWINLNRREKLVLAGAGVFLGLFLAFQLLIQPVFDKRAELRQRLTQRRQALAEMRDMQRQYLKLQARAENARDVYAGRPAGFTLFSFMDRLAGETGVKENITHMKPGSVTDETTGLRVSYVELKLQDVALEDLTAYLFRVETSKNRVRVNRLSISKSGEQEGLLSVLMQVETVGA